MALLISAAIRDHFCYLFYFNVFSRIFKDSFQKHLRKLHLISKKFTINKDLKHVFNDTLWNPNAIQILLMNCNQFSWSRPLHYLKTCITWKSALLETLHCLKNCITWKTAFQENFVIFFQFFYPQFFEPHIYNLRKSIFSFTLSNLKHEITCLSRQTLVVQIFIPKKVLRQ